MRVYLLPSVSPLGASKRWQGVAGRLAGMALSKPQKHGRYVRLPPTGYTLYISCSDGTGPPTPEIEPI